MSIRDLILLVMGAQSLSNAAEVVKALDEAERQVRVALGAVSASR